jgi:mono/diheme cytochrome c family protein
MPRTSPTLLIALAFAAPLAAQTPQAADHFEKSVRPVLVEHCLGCHGADGKKVKGGLNLTTRAHLLAGGDSGAVVVPGDAAKSLLVAVVTYDGEMKMPPKGKLKDADIATLTAWVRAGAAWPDAEVAVVAPPKQSGPLFTAEQKAFWAFQPVKPVAAPAVPGVTNPIDAFLRTALAARGLVPAPPAAPAVWLRRVSYDLTGLPPTPGELDAFTTAFAADPRAARAAAVERLLASPHYGERWGRHWLDVARYADSNGMDENIAFDNAWHYRDYVVKSFNADKPFDAFLHEQLAGDLLSPSADPAVTAERLTALGYLAVGPKLLAEPDKQKMLLDIADEQLDTVSRGVMGLTLSCARCHDHKFDPLPARDYYSLLAVFTSTRTMQGLGTVAKVFERTLTPETPAQAALRARLPKLKAELQKLEADFGKLKPDDAAGRLAVHAQAHARRAVIRWSRKLLPPQVVVLGVEEGGAYGTQPRNLYVQARGNYAAPLEEAPAQFLRVIAGEAAPAFVSTTPNAADQLTANTTRFGSLRASSGRLELARWLTSPGHPLTARVFVNRVWKHHFGEGLVRSVDNFGRLGERPSHPELLDYLAGQFVGEGWGVKALHRAIVLSDAYAMGQATDPAGRAADPDNRLVWQYPRRRLEAEPLRDAMLAVAGTLDPAVGGTMLKGANQSYSEENPKYASSRRSVYLPVLRSNLFDFFQTFDFPEPGAVNGRRESTVVAPQSLWLMNNPFVANQATAFAARLHREAATDEARVALAYRLAYARRPTPAELTRALGYVKDPAAWPRFAHALLAANEFQYLN